MSDPILGGLVTPQVADVLLFPQSSFGSDRPRAASGIPNGGTRLSSSRRVLSTVADSTRSPSQFNIVNETRRLLRIFEIEASQKGIKLKLTYGPSFAHLGELVEADPVRLNQITM